MNIKSNHKQSFFRVFVAMLAATVIFSACNKTEDFIIDYKHEYYPAYTGHYVIYDVDSIVFDDFTQTSDTFIYQKMHVLDSVFLDNTGRENFKLMRYQRADPSQAWQFTEVWYVLRTQTTLEIIEENARYVKLLFPQVDNMTWAGNQYISIINDNKYLENWSYRITARDVPQTINGLSLDSTITVMQHDQENLIEKIYGEERYAKHAGLVYKKLIWLKKQNVSVTWQQPEWGFILTMTVNDYGPK